MKHSIASAVIVFVLVAGAAGSIPPAEADVAFTFWFLAVSPPTCILNTGVCTMSMTNNGWNSSYDLALVGDYCNADLIYANNSTGTYYTLGNGTAGGHILNGIPFGANLTATCTFPTTDLKYEPNDQAASGFFTLKLVHSLGSFPAGMTARAEFEGVWFASPTPITTTQTVTTTIQNEDVPSLPYLFLIAGLVIVALVTSSFALRSRGAK